MAGNILGYSGLQKNLYLNSLGMGLYRYLGLLILGVLFSNQLTGQMEGKYDCLGRWDLTMYGEDNSSWPSWLEVSKSGHETLVGRFVYAFGSARPISHITYSNGEYQFSIPRQWEPEGQDMAFTFKLMNGRLKGTMTYTDGVKYQWTGQKQAVLPHTQAPKWGEPITLFNGKNLDGWIHDDNTQWEVIDGILNNPKSGVNLITTEKFTDFKLHVEFKYPKDGNSGIYLRGRYEVQVQDDYGKAPTPTNFGGIYGFLCPNQMAAFPAETWQSYDITLIGQRVTVVANGQTIIADQTIPGITGGALDSDEGSPGPIFLQGDHGPVQYRNVILTPRVAR